MKSQQVTHRFFLLFLPFLLTGCYTQFQTFDQFPVEDRAYSSNYAWDEYEGSSQSTDQYDQQAVDSEAEAMEQQLALEEMGIYYQDYETKQWYKDHYADKLYWQGYQDGYDDGYFDGWANNGYFSNNYWYGNNHYRYYNPYYRHYVNPRFHASFGFGYGGFAHSGYYGGYYNSWGYYGPYYYDYYWGHPHYNYHVYYNAYHWNKKYSRDADLYRKGPRNSGLVNRGDVRTRGSNGLTRGNNSRIDTRGTGVTRSRSTNSGSRVRGTTGSSSVGRSSSGTVGKTRGSTVGKTRSNNSDSRSRGSGKSVGKRSSNGDSGKSRSRGGDSYQSTFGQTSVRDIDISEIRSRSYTIPPRTVQRSDYSSRRSVSIGDIFNSRGFDRSTFRNDSKSSFNTRFKSNTRSSTNSRSIKSSSSRSSSRSAKVTRSSSSNRSSGNKSSSSSSSKRSRGGN